MRLGDKLLLSVAVIVLTLTVLQPIVQVESQTESLQPGFNEAISVLQEAESAGAKHSELSQLVSLLNTALELNRQALTITSSGEVEKRVNLLAQVDLMLSTVQAGALHLRTTATKRTSNDRTLAYVWGLIAAILGTICCALALLVYQKYRVKRTFQMKVTLK